MAESSETTSQAITRDYNVYVLPPSLAKLIVDRNPFPHMLHGTESYFSWYLALLEQFRQISHSAFTELISLPDSSRIPTNLLRYDDYLSKFLVVTCDIFVRHDYKNCNTAVEAFRRLQSLYAPKTTPQIYRNLRDILCKKNQSMSEYVVNMSKVQELLIDHHIPESQITQALFILVGRASNPEHMDRLMIKLESNDKADNFNARDFCLFTHDYLERNSLEEYSNPSHELVGATGPPTTKICRHCNRRGHIVTECWFKYPELRQNGGRGSHRGNRRGRGTGRGGYNNGRIYKSNSRPAAWDIHGLVTNTL